jgi:hypothetical protein
MLTKAVLGVGCVTVGNISEVFGLCEISGEPERGLGTACGVIGFICLLLNNGWPSYSRNCISLTEKFSQEN